jgi:DNA primase
VIVEGIFDAWRIGSGAVATFGTRYTHEQLLLLRGMKRAFILYDADAIPIAHKLAHDLSSIVTQIEVLELSEGDPDNLKEDDVRALRKDLNL